MIYLCDFRKRETNESVFVFKKNYVLFKPALNLRDHSLFFKFGRYDRANVSVYFLSSFSALTFKRVSVENFPRSIRLKVLFCSQKTLVHFMNFSMKILWAAYKDVAEIFAGACLFNQFYFQHKKCFIFHRTKRVSLAYDIFFSVLYYLQSGSNAHNLSYRFIGNVLHIHLKTIDMGVVHGACMLRKNWLCHEYSSPSCHFFYRNGMKKYHV